MSPEENDIKRYREGSMPDAERHALEKRALSDPFLADALEGVELVSGEEFDVDMTVVSSSIVNRTRRNMLTPVRIAAGVVVLIGTASLLYFFDPSRKDHALALEKSPAPIVGDSLMPVPADTNRPMITMVKPEEKASGQKATKPIGQLNRAGGPESKRDEGKVAAQPTEPDSESALLDEEEISRKAATDEQKNDVKKEAKPVPLTTLSGKTTEVASDKVKDTPGRKKTVADRKISGKVTYEEDGTPLPGVNVIVKGTPQGTVTDVNGNYSLSIPDKSRIVFSFIGLATDEVEAGDKEVINVKMTEDASQLSEVVVTGYGAARSEDDREPAVKMAAPVGGIRAYNKYLESNLRYPREALDQKVKGKVTIQFSVSTTGQLSDFSILKGLGHGCDEEVIRLVKEGPDWSPSTRDDVPVESEVRVRMKFDPDKAGK